MRALATALLLLLAACGKPEPVVIDGSSPEACERTTAEARRQLPDADRLLFDRAMRTIGWLRHSTRDPNALARVSFDGMTAAEVVADQRSHER